MSDQPKPTIVERLRAAAAEPTSGLIVLHGHGEPRRVGATELYAMARERATVLAARGVGPGTGVGVVGPNAPDWFAWVHATWMLGATIVPLPVPIRVRDKEALSTQLRALADAFDIAHVASHERFVSLLPAERVVAWELSSSPGPLPEDAMVRSDPRSIALVQTTSGTTAMPKGVARTYGVIDSTALAAMMNPGELDAVRFLTYAPAAHGGGFLAAYAPVHPWLEYHMLAPDRFARDPGAFLRMIGRYGIRTMSATSSGLAAALRSIERNPDGVDLSSLEILTISFEMVDPDLLDRLDTVGGRYGLRRGVVCSYYGLSEGGGTRTALGSDIRIDELDLDVLVRDGIARPPGPGATVKRVASCGLPYGLELRIADKDGPLPDRHVGEVQFRGRSLMRSYVGPGAEVAFDDDGWMMTGDAGYLDDGELFLTGRVKEVLVQQGKKYNPEDIERAAAGALDLAPTACVAFAVDEGEIVVLVEAEPSTDSDQRVRAAVMNAVGAVVRTVAFVPADALPKTASGKAQRLLARDRFRQGAFS